jgi:hypothetical protein
LQFFENNQPDHPEGRNRARKLLPIYTKNAKSENLFYK